MLSAKNLLNKTVLSIIIGIILFMGAGVLNEAYASTSLSGAYCSISESSYFYYTGSSIRPDVTVKTSYYGSALVEGEDYELSYASNKYPGTAKITVTGIGEYTGSKTLTFTIRECPLTSSYVSIYVPDLYYTGKAVEPKPVIKNISSGITLTEGTDYTVDVKENKIPGTYTTYVNGIGYYSSYSTISYTINKQNIARCSIDKIADQLYTGLSISPEVVVKSSGVVLTKDDYTVSYSNNTDIGRASVTITGKNYCEGTQTVYFNIFGEIRSNMVQIGTLAYTGKVLKPVVTIFLEDTQLIEGKDYTVKYNNIIGPGTSEVTVTGKGYYKGSVTVPYTVYGRSAKQFICSPVETYTYSGKAICPSLSVYFGNSELIEGTDYTITYSNNVKPGYSKITVTGIGNYSGTKNVYFKIMPKATTIKKISKDANGNVLLTWKGIASNCKYKVYRNGKCIKTVSAGTTKYTDKSKKVKGKKYTYTVVTICTQTINKESKTLSSPVSNKKSLTY